ncbi:MAG: hypothetical protein HRT43_04575 [Campylobacteraceae bacterium]|nr:hypothetical protein [Campylobacteraceae bacterium]
MHLVSSSNIQNSKKHLLITLHGIRTPGNWQENLRKTINEQTNEVDYIAIQYGFFNFFTFFIPFLRLVTLRTIRDNLDKVFRENINKDIHIIAHSFGTYLIIKYLAKKNLSKKIKTIILAGSVLPTNYLNKIDISKNVERIINDCGSKDYVLWFTKMLILGLSDAGRSGFSTKNNNTIKNRFFKGGHSLYLNVNFFKQHWIPHLFSDKKVDTHITHTSNSRFSLMEIISSIFYRLKYVSYIFLFLMLSGSIG